MRSKKLAREVVKPYRDSGGGTSILDMRQKIAQKYSRIASRESGLSECYWPLFYDWGVLVSNRKKIGRRRPVDVLGCSLRFKNMVLDLAPCQFGGFVSYITGVNERHQNATEKITGKASVGRFVGLCEDSRRLKILTREGFGNVILRNKAFKVKGGELFNPLLGIRSDITGLRSWERVDYSKCFLTTRKGGPEWKTVKRRITEQFVDPNTDTSEAKVGGKSEVTGGSTAKIVGEGWKVLEDLMIDDSVPENILNRPLSTANNDNNRVKIKTTLFYLPRSESETKKQTPIPKDVLKKLATTDATGNRTTRREALEEWFGSRTDFSDQSIEGMQDPGRKLTRRQQSLLENKLDKRVVEQQTAVWAREQLRKKKDRETGGAFSMFQAELAAEEIPEQFRWGTEGPNPQPFARIVNYNEEESWCTATFLDGENLNTLVPVDNVLIKPNGYLYSMQMCKTSNSATATGRYYEMYDVGALCELENDLKRSYSETAPNSDTHNGEEGLLMQKELGPGGRPALTKGEQDLRKIFSKEEILQGDLEEIGKHYDLNTWEEASSEEANLFRLVAGREPITIVILRKIKTLVDTTLKLKCRVILLANQLKTIPCDSPFKLDGGSTPAQLALTCMDAVDIVEIREEVTGDGKSAFPSTTVFRDAESSAPLYRDDKTGEVKRAHLIGRLPSSIPTTNPYVKITGGANGASSNPIFYDSTSDARLLCGPLTRSSRDGCLFIGADEFTRDAKPEYDLRLAKHQIEGGVDGSELKGVRGPFCFGRNGHFRSAPDNTKPIIRKHVDDYKESYKGTAKACLMKYFGKVLNIEPDSRVLVQSTNGVNWSCYLYLGVEYYRLAEQNEGVWGDNTRLFVGQNRYVEQLKARLIKEGHKFLKSKIAWSKAFGAEHMLDLETKKEEEVPLADTRELQGINGRIIPISKTGWQYLYPIKRSSSVPAFPSALKRSRQLEGYIASNFYLRAMVPEPRREKVDNLNKYHIRGFSDSDYCGEKAEGENDRALISNSGMYISISGMGVLAGTIKQPTCKLSVGEAELNANNVTSRACDSIVELLDELRITESELISEELVMDNSSGIDINLNKSLGKRSMAFKNRELGVRTKLASPYNLHPIKITKVDTLLNPADCMTKPLADREFQDAMGLMDIFATPLVTEGASFEQMIKHYGEYMCAYECVEERVRKGTYK